MSCGNCKQGDVVEPVPYEPLKIRFVVANDVYIIDNYPHFASAKKIESEGPSLTIATIAGDFLAPSLLSTIDNGVGMIQAMNESGVDYVCIGNHENDVKLTEMQKRIKESKFTWINSNMLNLPLAAGMDPLPTYKIIEVEASGQKRRICLLGLNTEDPKCVPPGRFGNCNIDPVNDTAARLYRQLKDTEKLDAIIPLTHQYMPEDRKLADMKVGFPVILGGHDHIAFHEIIHDCHVLKVGMNMEKIGIVDLEWATAHTIKPVVTVTMKDASSYPRDPVVEQLVKKHKYVLEQMEKAALFGLPKGHTLTSKNVREQPSSMATFIFTLVKRIMQVDCVLLAGGGVRGDTDYTGHELFTYADLMAEFTFPMPLVVLPLPGWLIVDIIQFTRAGSLKSPPESKAYFMQTDDGVRWHKTSNQVTSINGEAVVLDKVYNCALNYLHALRGLDHIEPLVQYSEKMIKNRHVAFVKDMDTAIELKHLLIAHFSKLVLFNMLSPKKVLAMDENNDGLISREEFRNAARRVHGGDVSDLLVDNLFNIADIDGDGNIDQHEIQTLLKLASDSYTEPSPVLEAIHEISGWFSWMGAQMGAPDLIGGLTAPADRKNSDIATMYSNLSSNVMVFSMDKEHADSMKVKVVGT